jgi:hypothetical protein
MSQLTAEPVQPPKSAWTFVDELQCPLWHSVQWQTRDPRRGEVALKKGVSLPARFPDPRGVLETAYEDLDRFLVAARVLWDSHRTHQYRLP